MNAWISSLVLILGLLTLSFSLYLFIYRHLSTGMVGKRLHMREQSTYNGSSYGHIITEECNLRFHQITNLNLSWAHLFVSLYTQWHTNTHTHLCKSPLQSIHLLKALCVDISFGHKQPTVIIRSINVRNSRTWWAAILYYDYDRFLGVKT